MRLRFGEFGFDDSGRSLSRAGVAIPLSPRAFDLLQLLLEQRPRVLTQAELRDRLWPDTVVAYTSLARLVTEVRHALADSSERPRFVRTVYGCGYAFIGDAVAALSCCGLEWAGHRLPLVEGENLIGRGDDCQVRIESTKVSRHHAKVVVAGGEATIEDLGSKNGTYLGTARVQAPARLATGAEILVGTAVLRFVGPAGQGATETA
ncbi:MAG: FHA domain-containing protein [Vicinamibacteria bacterium]|nr:FHA domain-containing protein [Vicinamibacteria bacterium]